MMARRRVRVLTALSAALSVARDVGARASIFAAIFGAIFAADAGADFVLNSLGLPARYKGLLDVAFVTAFLFAFLCFAILAPFGARSLRVWRERSAKPRIEPAPGSTLERIGRLVCTPRAYDRTIAPLVTDYREEYFEALARKDEQGARLVRWSYYWAFTKTLVLTPLAGTVEFARKLIGM